MTDARRKHLEYCRFVLCDVAGAQGTTIGSAARLRIMAGRLDVELAIGASEKSDLPTVETLGDDDDPGPVLIAKGGKTTAGGDHETAAGYQSPTMCVPPRKYHKWNGDRCVMCGVVR